MENSSHALLIAGGILIAVMTLSIFAMLFHNLEKIGEAQALKAEAQELKEWNQQWEAYNKEYLYFTELKTLANKAEETKNTEFEVKIEVMLYENGPSVPPDSPLLISSAYRYSCISIKYNNMGRVCKMVFLTK